MFCFFNYLLFWVLGIFISLPWVTGPCHTPLLFFLNPHLFH